MLIALATIFLFMFGGSGLEFYLTNLKGSVKDHVADKDRQEVVIDASKQLGKDLKHIQKDVEKQFDAYVEEHTDYTSEAAAFDAITEQMVGTQQRTSAAVLDARDKMRAQMTADEWKAVFKPE